MADRITIAQMVDAVELTLSAALTTGVSQSYDGLTEGVNDLPTLQVYWESCNQDAQTGTNMSTFQGGTKQTSTVIHADYYARQRSQIGEDMKALVDGTDAIIEVLERQNKSPFFDLGGIKNFKWSASRVIFTYADEQIKYMGARFIIELRTY